jgi:hypothetical protein
MWLDDVINTCASSVVSVPRAATVLAFVAFAVMFSDFQIFNGTSILIFNGAATAVFVSTVSTAASR